MLCGVDSHCNPTGLDVVKRNDTLSGEVVNIHHITYVYYHSQWIVIGIRWTRKSSQRSKIVNTSTSTKHTNKLLDDSIQGLTSNDCSYNRSASATAGQSLTRGETFATRRALRVLRKSSTGSLLPPPRSFRCGFRGRRQPGRGGRGRDGREGEW